MSYIHSVKGGTIHNFNSSEMHFLETCFVFFCFFNGLFFPLDLSLFWVVSF